MIPKFVEISDGKYVSEHEMDGIKFTIGSGGDFEVWEIENTRSQIVAYNMWHSDCRKKVGNSMLRAILLIKKVFPGSYIPKHGE